MIHPQTQPAVPTPTASHAITNSITRFIRRTTLKKRTHSPDISNAVKTEN